ncbi:MAG: hypothetical protein ACP5IL_02230 [Syntrophobacteraceae bacterium]
MKERQHAMCPNSSECSRPELALEDQCEMPLFTGSLFAPSRETNRP